VTSVIQRLWLDTLDLTGAATVDKFLLPGSKHRSGGVYSIYKDLPIAEVPDWLAEIDVIEKDNIINSNSNTESNQPIPRGQQDEFLTRTAWSYAGKGSSEQAIAEKLTIDVQRALHRPRS